MKNKKTRSKDITKNSNNKWAFNTILTTLVFMKVPAQPKIVCALKKGAFARNFAVVSTWPNIFIPPTRSINKYANISGRAVPVQ